jgi:Na+/H+ antiporter NhaC
MVGMIDICILALLLMACVNIMRLGDGDKALISISEKVVSTARGAEASIAGLVLAMSSVMGLNAPPILAIGIAYAKPIGKKFRIHPYRIANILDAFACTLVFSLPWTPVLLLFDMPL